MRSRVFAAALLCVAGGLGLFGPRTAAAIVVPLTVEFDTGATGEFGSVEVTQNGDDLDFRIALGPDLNALGGGAPDLSKFYFNLVGDFTGLRVVADDAPGTGYSVAAARSVRGGAGSRFDFEVDFGNGAGAKGNGALGTAAFTLSADQALALIALSETSQPNHVDTVAQPINFAIHAQGTAAFFGSSSEAVGGGTSTGVIPEPATVALTAIGILGVAFFGGRGRR